MLNKVLVISLCLMCFVVLQLHSADKRLSEAERLKLAIEIATKNPNGGITIRKYNKNNEYYACLTQSGTEIGTEGYGYSVVQAVDSLMKMREEKTDDYPEPRVLGYIRIKNSDIVEGKLYLFDDLSLKEPQFGTVKNGKVLLLGETSYRDILNTSEIYLSR